MNTATLATYFMRSGERRATPHMTRAFPVQATHGFNKDVCFSDSFLFSYKAHIILNSYTQ